MDWSVNTGRVPLIPEYLQKQLYFLEYLFLDAFRDSSAAVTPFIQ